MVTRVMRNQLPRNCSEISGIPRLLVGAFFINLADRVQTIFATPYLRHFVDPPGLVESSSCRANRPGSGQTLQFAGEHSIKESHREEAGWNESCSKEDSAISETV
jgi:hypothetical protein